MLLKTLDIFFLIFHSLLIVFNLFGWIWKSTRKANLVTLLLTAFSWVGLGIFFGLGYCPLTDWHWEILIELGRPPQTPSYVAYLFQRILGISVSISFADNLTLIAFLIALSASLFVNIWDRIRMRK